MVPLSNRLRFLSKIPGEHSCLFYMGVPRDLFGTLYKMCWLPLGDIFNAIPQKLKLPMNFFDTFPECSLPSTSTVSKNTIKMIDHHVRLKRCLRANLTQFMPVLVLVTCVINQSKLYIAVAGGIVY